MENQTYTYIDCKKIKMRVEDLERSSDILKRAFFKEAILNGWTYEERSKVFEECRNKSFDYDNLVSILQPYIDTEYLPQQYEEPGPLPLKIWEFDSECLFYNPELFVFEYTLTEDFLVNPHLLIDEDDPVG